MLLNLSWRYFARHRVQSGLVLSGVALGVAAYVGIETAARSLAEGMRDTIDRVAGRAQLEVSAGETGVPEETLEQVRARPEVLAASPVVEATVRAPALAETSLLLLGIDFLGDRELRQWEFDDDDVLDDPLLFLAQPDSICVTRDFATRNHLGRGSTLVLRTLGGDRPFTIRGLIEASGPAKAYGGSIVVMDVYAAQFQLGRGARFDRIDVRIAARVELETARQSLATALGVGFEVATPERRSAQLSQLLATFAATLRMGSWQALLVAVFLIYNIFAVASVRRRVDIGVLRALGATRRQIAQLFLLEGALLGLVGTVLGIVAGRWLASSMVRVMQFVTESAYGFTGAPPTLRMAPNVALSALLLGVGAALLGAFLPARHAARIDPVQALSRVRFLVPAGRERKLYWIAGGAALLVGVAVATATSSIAALLVVIILLHLAVILLAPTLIRLATRALRPLSARTSVEAQLAAEGLHAAPKRTNAAVLALVISISFVWSIAGFIASFAKAYDTWITNVVTGDLYVTASPQFISKPLRLPDELAAPLEQIPGVRWVEPFRSFRFHYRDKSPIAVALPFERTYQRLALEVYDGDPQRGRQQIARGEGFGVSANFARLFGSKVGDPLTLPTPTGPLTLPVALIVLDYSSDQGVVWFDRRLLLERFGDHSCDYLIVMRQPDADIEAIRRAVIERLKQRTDRLFLFTGPEFRAEAQRLFDQFFSFTYVQLLLALVVAMLGITNTLVISVMERTGEIGLVRAVGGSRRQVAWLVMAEALVLAVLGTSIGLVFGTVLLHLVAVKLSSLFTGWIVPTVFPLTFALLLWPAVLLVSAAAAFYPARLAAGLTPTEALAAE